MYGANQMKRILTFCAILTASSQLFASDWRPVSAESLIELPANLIEKRIEQDFNLSPMANNLLNLENDLVGVSEQIQSLQLVIENASEQPMIDERVKLVQLKSTFLDLLQDSQTLRQSQLQKKIGVYQNVLDKLYQQKDLEQKSDTYELILSQEKAKARMQKMMDTVDQTLLQNSVDAQSPYAKEFASNLEKINQLKDAISNHQANLASKIDGIEVTTQEYIRQLLMQSSSEQSLLDQESLMLSYMAKVVALDAQSLEFEIGELQASTEQVKTTTSPSTSVSLFL